ncbi:hypothetical protein [Corynebacterium testudinoris]|nr:hypothetical protein [Corynebacterium testudinoris]
MSNFSASDEALYFHGDPLSPPIGRSLGLCDSHHLLVAELLDPLA